MKLKYRALAFAATALVLGHGAWAGEAEAKKWIDSEFQPSTLSKDEQLKELEWFIKAAEPFKGMEINVVSETLTTHEYESKVLAKAFSEITGARMMPKSPAAITDPNIAVMPRSGFAAMASIGLTAAKVTPIITGRRMPKGPIPSAWIRVTMPQHSRSALISRAI